MLEIVYWTPIYFSLGYTVGFPYWNQLYVTSQSPYGIQELWLSFVFSLAKLHSRRKEKGRIPNCGLDGKWRL